MEGKDSFAYLANCLIKYDKRIINKEELYDSILKIILDISEDEEEKEMIKQRLYTYGDIRPSNKTDEALSLFLRG